MYPLSKLLILSLSLSLLSVATMADDTLVISQLTNVDREFMQSQLDRIDSLARIHLGQQVNGDKANDLSILQKLLDRRLVRADQPLELQAMGVVFGNLLAAELGMKWVLYEDRLGRTRALHMPASDHYTFAMTMISRRVEADAPVNTNAIYDKAYRRAYPYKTKLPFQ